jgi:hypothetical protein
MEVKYIILNKDNIVENIVLFDESQDLDLLKQMTIDIHKSVHGPEDIRLIRIDETVSNIGIGYSYNGKDFKPIQPYPSWIWDPSKFIWRSPVMHPEFWLDVSQYNYAWNEEAQSWDLV